MISLIAALALAGASEKASDSARVCAVDNHLHAYETDPRLRNRVPNPASGVPAPPDAAAHLLRHSLALDRTNTYASDALKRLQTPPRR